MVKVLQIVFAALSVALLSAGAARFYVQEKGLQVPVEVLHAFKLWQTKHQKFYGTPMEEIHRALVFFANYLKVKSHDASLGWTVELNGFADMDTKEFTTKYTGLNLASRPASKNVKTFNPTNVGDNPKSVDWRAQGAVNPIKNQGSCGSCWAFSANAGFESAAYLAGYTPLYSYSEQQLVDCATEEGNQGCNGGWMTSAYDYVIKVGGLQTEQSYPYTGKDDACTSDKSKFAPPQITGYIEVPENRCDLLETAVAQQPVTVAVDANAWQFYKNGVFSSAFCTNYLNHGVAAVGYSNDASKPYWIIRNSWGTTWGEEGYMLLNKVSNAGKQGLCGVCMVTAFPEVAAPSSN